MFQGLALSAIFIALIFLVYCGLSLLIAQLTKEQHINERKQKWIDGSSGALLTIAAAWLLAKLIQAETNG